MRVSPPLTLNLERLQRDDLEALALYKLHEEMGIDVAESRPAVAEVDQRWLVAFLKHGDHIALSPLDGAALSQARRFKERIPA